MNLNDIKAQNLKNFVLVQIHKNSGSVYCIIRHIIYHEIKQKAITVQQQHTTNIKIIIRRGNVRTWYSK